MSKKKKPLKTLLIIFGSIIIIAINAVAFIFVSGMPWSIMYIGGVLSEDPPQPEYQYGEFPFKIVYEFNGEKIILEDVLVIEHKGVSSWSTGRGKQNVWNVYLKSGEVELSSFLGNDYALSLAVAEEKEIMIFLGNCEYYMGLEPDQRRYTTKGMVTGDVFIYPSCDMICEEIYHEYGFTIIEACFSSPITEKQTSVFK